MLLIDSPLFEAYVASCSFALFILFFKTLHTTSLSRYRFPTAKTINFVGKLSLDMGIFISLPVYLLAIHSYHRLNQTPSLNTQRSPINHSIPPSLFRLATELIVGLIAYDSIFFFIHKLLHKSTFLFHHIHSHHHHHNHLTPGSTVSHSLIDGMLQVMTNIAVQQYSLFGYKHTYSRLLHNVLVTYLLVEAHSEFDAPWSLHNIFGEKIYGGALRHRYHHARKTVHYSQFFTFLDDWYGSSVSAQKCRAVRF
jgi:hypothetical protein